MPILFIAKGILRVVLKGKIIGPSLVISIQVMGDQVIKYMHG